MRRVWVVGDSGSGKTSVARAIAERIGAPHTELDALFHGPNWTPAPDDVFRHRVKLVVEGDQWVIDGNYWSRTKDVILPRVDTIVWLDYPMRITWPRVVGRSVRRAIDRQELWNGNRERASFWIRPSHPIWWTLSHHRRVRRRYTESADDRWVRLRHPRLATRWLDALER